MSMIHKDIKEAMANLDKMTNQKPCVVLHASLWRKAREQKLCDYTDEEFNAALNGNGIIKTGPVYGTGFMGMWGEVHMVIDRPFPTLENVKERALQMEYTEKLEELL